MSASWINDAAVEIADIIDTPDFETNPNRNAGTILIVHEVLVRNLLQFLPTKFVPASRAGVYDIVLAGEVIGSVSRGLRKTWWAYGVDGRVLFAGAKTRSKALEHLLWRGYSYTKAPR